MLEVLNDAEGAQQMAARARAEVTAHWDMAAITHKLAQSYREVVAEKRTKVTSA